MRKLVAGMAIVLIVIFTVSVIAKGSSSYRPDPVPEPVVIDCNAKSLLQERILCRLENGGNAPVPEACAGLSVEQECITFYDRAGYCYDLSAREKDACFQKESGYAANPADEQAKRLYINALLYELEEYAEDEYDNNQISATTAAELVSDIIRIKRFLLSGRELSFIQEKVEEYAKKKNI
ncbi:MAG TPA: hypothetical protein VJI32_00890 [Candidatus Nanoarchaeia archaeon]|nr:hypothetical protein [Candidatus Nanoarchaeia archaeon]